MGEESACSAGDAGHAGLISGSGRSPAGGHGNPSSVLAWRIPWTEEPGGLLLLLSRFSRVVSDSVRPHRWQPTRLLHPWDSPGKNTGVGCHFLLQCMKVKRESEVAQSCPTLSDLMNCSLPGSPVPGIFQARTLEWGAISFSNA